MTFARVWADREVYASDEDRIVVRAAGFGEQAVTSTLEHVPRGLKAVTRHIGVARDPALLDFSLVRLPGPCASAALYTQSLCPSPAVVFNRENLTGGLVELIGVVSKNAAAFTSGARADIEAIVAALAQEFGLPRSRVMLSCTGVIGRPLPIDRILAAIPGLGREMSADDLARVPEAIMTTDKRPKCASLRLGDVVIGGYAKGAGMVEPNLATMLVYLYSNVKADPGQLRRALAAAAERTFNALSVDTDTSTSDTLGLFATGEVGVPDDDFELGLTAVCLKLARAVAREAEGATKLIEVRLGVPTTRADALLFAKKVVNSPLVKTAIHGADPNWGRVIMAVGKPARGATVERIAPEDLVVEMQGRRVYDRGLPLTADLDALSADLAAAKTVHVDVTIGAPVHTAVVWGCDLSADYVRENADYTS